MTWVIVAGALGVIISITGGLFLRRLFGQLAGLRRQITGIDREMRAQRARVTVLRQLLEEESEEDDGDSGPPPQAGAVNGQNAGPPPDVRARPVRRKRHLELILGGAAAALVSVTTVVRDAVRGHHGQAIAAATGAVVTATAVAMVTVQPWMDDNASGPAPSAPTATVTYVPSGSPPTGPPGAPPGSTSEASPSPGKPTDTAPAPEPSASLTPTGDASPATQADSPDRGRGRGASLGASAPGRTHQPTPPGQSHRPTPPAQPQSPGPPATPGQPSGNRGNGRGRGVAVRVTVMPLIDAGVCIVCG